MGRMARAAALAATGLALAGALLPGAARAAVVPDPPLTDADYFTFADQVAAEMESSWKPEQEVYRTGARSIDTIANAAMLTVFATSAAHGHVGPARNDPRARLLVKKLTASPPYWTAPDPPYNDKMFHTPGWTSNLEGPYVDMDKSIDPKVAEGLQIAYRAADVLGLDEADLRAIRDEIHAVSHVPFFRYPLVRLNQINWNAELYAYDWLVNGDPTLLRIDYRRHVHRFVAGFKRPWTRDGSTNVGPSYRFTYQNNAPESLSRNLDSAEYANMTLHFLYWYDAAVKAGMTPLSREDRRLLRGWVQRDLYGYWTHAGFMNWDTGWSYERWMKGKAWAYAQQGLLAIATSPAFTRRSREQGYAKYLFDRGLRLYEHLGLQPPGRPWRPSAQLYGIGEQGAPATKMFWARMAANAARAVSAGMGRMRAVEPPPFYAFDADIGRLAVSTPRYSSAILAVNRGKVPYGGIELARLYDADGDPIGGTGGRPPASFGVLVTRAAGGRRVLASQTGRHSDPRKPPIVLTRSPLGRVDHQKRLATQPDAGPFSLLTETGAVARGGARVRSSYRFRRDAIGVRWRVTRTGGTSAQRVRVLFPTSGRKAVVIEALLRDGRTVVLTDGARPPLARVREFRLRSAYGSYVVELDGRPTGTTDVLARRHDRANPRGGPTLALELPRIRTEGGVRELSVRIVPSQGGGVVDTPPEPAPATTPPPDATAPPVVTPPAVPTVTPPAVPTP
jgi:hypothetical protein